MGNLSDQIRILTPVDRVWRTDVKVAAALLSAQADNGVSVTLNDVNVNTGQWVTYDANGDLILASAGNRSFMVFRGGADRSDNTATEAVTIVKGEYEGFSQVYNVAGAFAAGTELTTTGGQLDEAASGDFVVGFAYGAPANSELHFETFAAGYVKA